MRPEGLTKPKLSAFDAGIRLLARRSYASVEMGRRLLRLGYEEESVKPTLDALVELGFINDAKFADQHVARRAGKRGPRGLAAELTAKGIDRELVRAAVGHFDRDAQVRMAARQVRRNIGSNLPPTYKELLQKAGPRLLRRGYSQSIASAACQAVWTGAADLVLGA
jgi:regulatory protein